MAQSVKFSWNLSEKQAELFQSKARFRVGMMGRRFGKNEVGSACIIDYTTQPAKYSWGSDEDPISWWVGPSYRQAYRYGYKKVKEKLPDKLIDEDNTRGSEWGPSLITLWDGREMEFLSYGNPAGLQGAGVDLIVGDEWAYSDESLWNNDLRPMLMDSGGGAVLISKPLGENHFYENYQRGDDPEFPEWQSFHATAYDNPFIPDSEVDKAKKSTPESIFRQEYLADPQAGGTLLTLDMLDKVPAQTLEDRRQWKWHVAVDIGVTTDKKKARENNTDYWACAIVAENPVKPKAYVVDIVRERGQTPAQAANWIKGAMSPIPTQNVYYEAVQAQQWLEGELKEVGLNPIAVTHDRPKEERIMFLSVPFDNGNVKLIDWEDTENNVDWSDFRTEWAGFPNSDHDDQLDALEMALRNVDFGGRLTMVADDAYGRDNEDN